MLEQLGDICTVQGGFAFKSADFGDTGIPVIKIADVTGGSAMSYGTMQRVEERIAESANRFYVEANDTLISMTGANVGKITRVWPNEPHALINQRVGRFVPRFPDKFSKDFIYYLVSSSDSYDFFRNAAYGSAQPNISSRLIESLPLPQFGESDPIAIGSLLRSLDNKIELNRKTAATLEEMARALYRSWFVDFDPVRAKSEGRAPAHMDADTAALFPDSFGEDGLPEGWQLEPIIDQAEWVNGAAYKNMHFSEAPDALPVVKIAELKAGVTQSTKFTATNLGDKYLIDRGDLLFSWSGNPDTSIDAFIWDEGKAWLNQHIFAVRPNGKMSIASLFVMMKHFNSDMAEIARNKQTTGLGHITRKDLEAFLITVAPEPIIFAFEKRVGPLHSRYGETLYESKTLATLRDTLLPKLMSGEIRVGEAREQIEEVA